MAIQLRTEIAVPLLKFWEHGMLNMKSIVYPEIGFGYQKMKHNYNTHQW